MEIEIIKFFQSNSNALFDYIWTIISYLASFIGFLIVFIIIFIFFNKIYAIFFAGTYSVGITFNYILKSLINRPRPYEISSAVNNLLEAVGKSMPSGHTVSIVIIVSFILFLIITKSKNKLFISLSVVVSLLLTVMVIISRMYLGQHFISDCMVGFIIGLVFAVLGILLFTQRRNIYEHFRYRKKEE